MRVSGAECVLNMSISVACRVMLRYFVRCFFLSFGGSLVDAVLVGNSLFYLEVDAMNERKTVLKHGKCIKEVVRVREE